MNARKKVAEVSTAVGAGMQLRFTPDKHPRIQVRDTDFGFIYGAFGIPTGDPDKWVYIRASAVACSHM